VARRPSVRWNEDKQRWMAWVRFPDGSRSKVERVEKADAERDLNALLELRAQKQSPGPGRQRLATFNEVVDAWFAADCPKVAVSKTSRRARAKAPNTIATAKGLLKKHVRSQVGGLKVDRTKTDRVEQVFHRMADAEYATSTIDHVWCYLNQACVYGLRKGVIKTNPVADALLPAARPAKKRKSFTIDQVDVLLRVAIPADRRPALWITGLMCGPQPGEQTPPTHQTFTTKNAAHLAEVRQRPYVRDGLVGQ
jgi:hypothetical protein